ncbi:RNA polymerase sigma factor [Marilutibacter maris]|nr:RNA polymerase sigma factor [Lysobacter maris]AWV06201.1 RNA polymerase sigma factor, sigma-70 family protein [Lysobacter maris]
MHSLWPSVEAFHPQLWRAVCGYERNPALREELMQEVLLAVWEALPKLRDPDRLLPFVLRIAHNLGASHVRSSVRTPALVAFDADVHDSLSQTSAGEAERARTQWLFEALATLPVNLRQPLMLQLEGFDYQEIADMLGISSDNVGVRVHRARERLKTLSRQEDADELR